MPVLEELKEAVIAGNATRSRELAEQAISAGRSAAEVLNDALIAAMNIIGPRFKNNEIYVPEVLIAARAMHAGMAVVKPLIVQAGIKEKGTIILGTVKGDLHDIGKNLVGMMLEGAGYRVIDLGVDVSSDKFVAAVEEHQPQVLGLSALLTTTMSQMKVTLDRVKAQGLRIKTLVGGAPVTEKFASEIGADGYAPDAASAVEIINSLMGA